MIQTENFQELVYGFWSRRFESENLAFERPYTFIYPDSDLHGKDKAIIYRIGKMCVLRSSPNLLGNMNLPSLFPCEEKAITEADLQEVLVGKWQVELKSTLLDWFLDAVDHQVHLPPEGINARRVDPIKEDAVLRALYADVTADDLDEAEIYVDEPDPIIYGLFEGEKMAAYASHRYWEDLICDIGVLVHPDYRSRGLGKAVVSTLCAWCIENEKIPMYRVFEYNAHSMRVPEALGFKKIVTIDSIEITKERY